MTAFSRRYTPNALTHPFRTLNSNRFSYWQTELQDIPSLDKLRRSSAERAAEEDRLVAAHGELTIDADAGAGTRASVGEDTRGEGVKDGDIPTLREITKYFRDLYHRTNLKFDCVVLSLIYVEHLMKVSNAVESF